MKTITFYSYKGGVGRSLVLANLAQRLVEFGKSVCMLDFDLEAPGLPFKFDAEKILAMNKKGVVDFVTEYQKTQKPPQTLGNDYAILLNPDNKHEKSLHLITAGNTNKAEFWKNLAALNWKDMFYSEHGQGVRLVLHLKALIEKEIAPDYLLVDSRTGVTETSGIALSILADRIVIVAANNEENIYGSKLIMKGLLNNRVQEVKPDIHFILSRVPFTKEPNDRLKEKDRIEQLTSDFNRENINLYTPELNIIHSERMLEEEEQFLIGEFYKDKEVFAGEDYRKIYRNLFVQDFNIEENYRFESQERAREIFQEYLHDNDKEKLGLDKQLSILNECIRLEPNRAIYYNNRAFVFEELQKYEEAAKDHLETIKLSPGTDLYYTNIAYFYIARGKLERAIEAVNEGIAMTGENNSYLLARSQAYEEFGNYEKAESDLRRAVDISGNLENLKYHLAEFLFRRSKYREALQEVNALLLSNSNSSAYTFLASKLHAKMGQMNEFYINLNRALNDDEYLRTEVATSDFFLPYINDVAFNNILYKYGIKPKWDRKNELEQVQSSLIEVIGVGGGGSNTVTYMYDQGIVGANFTILNTDSEALKRSIVPSQIQIGQNLTNGSGSNAKPEIGEKSAEESITIIKELLSKNTKLVFITAGMGGGTGTGAAPVVARIAKEMGILTIGIVTTPFWFEGKARYMQARNGIKKMKEYVDTLIVLNNNKIREMYGNLTRKEAFNHVNNILAAVVKSIIEILTLKGEIKIELEDLQAVIKDGGYATMGFASASGENRALQAVTEAMMSPVMADYNLREAKKVLVAITSGMQQITMDEIGEIMEYVQEAFGSTDIILGASDDPSLDDKLMIAIIATGFESEKEINPFFDKITYNTLINNSANYEQAKETLEEMLKLGIQPNVVTFNTLLNKCKYYEQGRYIFEEMSRQGVVPDVTSYDSLLNICRSYEQAREIFEEMRRQGVAPNVISYGSLLDKCRNYEQAREVFEEMNRQGVAPNEIVYNILLDKCKSYEQAREVFEEMNRQGVVRNQITFAILIDKCQSYEQAREVFEEMQQQRILPNEIVYNLLMNKCSGYEQAKALLEDMMKHQIIPNHMTYKILMDKSNNYEEMKEVLDEMVKQGIAPNQITHTTLMKNEEGSQS